MFEGVSKGRLALGALSVVGVVGGFFLDQKEAKEAQIKQEEITRQAAYKGGCDQARLYYAQKGNPKKMRKEARKGQ